MMHIAAKFGENQMNGSDFIQDFEKKTAGIFNYEFRASVSSCFFQENTWCNVPNLVQIGQTN